MSEIKIDRKDEQKDIDCAIINAALVGNEKALKLALSQGGDPNAVMIDIDGDKSALMVVLAARTESSEECIRALLEAGADPDLTEDFRGRTALMYAVICERPECVELLLRFGADPNNGRFKEGKNEDKHDSSGWTALHYAARNGCEKSARLLMEAGADKAMKKSDCWTPIMLACHNGHNSVLSLMLSEDSQGIDLTNDACETAVMVAIMRDHVECVRTLLAAGANLDLINLCGWDAEEMAREYECVDIEGLLRAEREKRCLDKVAGQASIVGKTRI